MASQLLETTQDCFTTFSDIPVYEESQNLPLLIDIPNDCEISMNGQSINGGESINGQPINGQPINGQPINGINGQSSFSSDNDSALKVNEKPNQQNEISNEIKVDSKQISTMLKELMSKIDDNFIEVSNLKFFSSKILKQNEELIEKHGKQNEKMNKLIETVDCLKEEVQQKNDLIFAMSDQVQLIQKYFAATKENVQDDQIRIGNLAETPAPTLSLITTSPILTDLPSTSSGYDSPDSPGGASVDNSQPQKIKKKKSSGNLLTQNSVVEDVERVKVEYTGNLAQVLQQVCTSIKLDPEEKKTRNKELQMIVNDRVVKGLKEDPLFNLLFQEIFGTGSFYEGLKVSKPDEFDLNMIMKLPHMPKQNNEKKASNGPEVPYIEITSEDAPAGFMKINNFGAVLKYLRETNDQDNLPYRKMETWCDEKGSLLQSKFRAWLESLMSTFINKHKTELMKALNLTHLRVRKSGPAMTLELGHVSIDLVPVIEVKPEHQQVSYKDFRPLTVDPTPLPFFLVPKPTTDGKDDDAWRFSAHRHERRMIEKQACLKPAIKLFKKLRDTQNWKNFHSYYIKTAAYWVIEENTINWNLKLDGVFLSFFKAVYKRLDENTIFHFWNRNYNMLHGMSDIERENIVKRMKKILNTYENGLNPVFLGETIAPYKD